MVTIPGTKMAAMAEYPASHLQLQFPAALLLLGSLLWSELQEWPEPWWALVSMTVKWS
jgi:hypothetical protein